MLNGLSWKQTEIILSFWGLHPRTAFQTLLLTMLKRQSQAKTTPKKDVLFIIGDWNAKVGSQETPVVTGKFGLGMRNEAGQILPRKCTGPSKHPLPTAQEKTLPMDIIRWSTPKSD